MGNLGIVLARLGELSLAHEGISQQHARFHQLGRGFQRLLIMGASLCLVTPLLQQRADEIIGFGMIGIQGQHPAEGNQGRLRLTGGALLASLLRQASEDRSVFILLQDWPGFKRAALNGISR